MKQQQSNFSKTRPGPSSNGLGASPTTPPAADRERPWRASPSTDHYLFFANRSAIIKVFKTADGNKCTVAMLRKAVKAWMTRREIDDILSEFYEYGHITVTIGKPDGFDSPVLHMDDPDFAQRDLELELT